MVHVISWSLIHMSSSRKGIILTLGIWTERFSRNLRSVNVRTLSRCNYSDTISRTEESLLQIGVLPILLVFSQWQPEFQVPCPNLWFKVNYLDPNVNLKHLNLNVTASWISNDSAMKCDIVISIGSPTMCRKRLRNVMRLLDPVTFGQRIIALHNSLTKQRYVTALRNITTWHVIYNCLTWNCWVAGLRERRYIMAYVPVWITPEYSRLSHIWTVTWLGFYCIVSF